MADGPRIMFCHPETKALKGELLPMHAPEASVVSVPNEICSFSGELDLFHAYWHLHASSDYCFVQKGRVEFHERRIVKVKLRLLFFDSFASGPGWASL